MIREKRYRQKLKEKKVNKPKTRIATEAERASWREQKRRQRENESRQKKYATNKKRRENYAAKRKIVDRESIEPQEVPIVHGIPVERKNSLQIEQEPLVQEEQHHQQEPHGTQMTKKKKTDGARRTSKWRHSKILLANLPSNRDLKVEVLAAGFERQSPSTVKLLKRKLGFQHNVESPRAKKKLSMASTITESLKGTIKNLRKSRNKRDLRLKRRLLAKAVNAKKLAISSLKSIGITRKLKGCVKKYGDKPGWEDNRRKRKDALPASVVSAVTEFFKRGDVSRDLLDARSARTKGEEVEARKVMEMSMSTSYDLFQEANKNIKIGYSTFKRLRPDNVLPFTHHKYRECLCEYCVNIDRKLKAVNNFCTVNGMKDKYAVSQLTLCPKDTETGEYKNVCLERKCAQCGTKLVVRHLEGVMEQQGSEIINWFHWEKVTLAGNLSRLSKVKKSTTFREMIELFVKDLDTFSYHLFNARWQWLQYKTLVDNIPENTVVFCVDYGENYTCRAQDAPQGFHWSNTQCTIHPVVASYCCPMCNSETVTDSIIFISDNLTHDHHAVNYFFGKATALLLEEEHMGFTDVQYSDGAPTQYKNRVSFIDCSYSYQDFNVQCQKHFFGSRHGKGPCDREIGVLKKAVKNAVAAGRCNVFSASDLFLFCQKNLVLPKQNQRPGSPVATE